MQIIQIIRIVFFITTILIFIVEAVLIYALWRFVRCYEAHLEALGLRVTNLEHRLEN